MTTLAGQTVVLVGGIGLATARRARPGAPRSSSSAAEVGTRRTAAFDATDPAAVARFFQDVPAPIDHVVVALQIARNAVGPAARCRSWAAPAAGASPATSASCPP